MIDYDTRPDTVRTWPVLLLALPAFVAIWSGWVGLGELAGFGIVHPLPGIWDSVQLNTAITLPIGVETYAAYALHVWLTARARPQARRFAKWSAIGSLMLGMAGQGAYHLMISQGMTHAPWLIVTLVSCLPVAVLGMGAALAHLVRAPEDVHAVDSPSDEAPEVDAFTMAQAANTAVAALLALPEASTDGPSAPGQDDAPRRRGGPPSNADRVAKAVVRWPGASPARIADRLDLSERTVLRHWPAPSDDTVTSKPTPPEEINGREPELAATSEGAMP